MSINSSFTDKGSHLLINKGDRAYLIPKQSIMLPPPTDDRNVLIISNAIQFAGESINAISLSAQECGYQSSHLLWFALMQAVIVSESDLLAAAGAQIRCFTTTLTRPANKDAYTAGDVIGDVSGQLIKFTNVAKAAGKGCKLIYFRGQTDDVNFSEKTIQPYFYNTTDANVIADNQPFIDAWANSFKRVGSVPITFKPFRTGSDSVVAFEKYVDIPIQPVGRDIGLQIEAVTAVTPNNNSSVFRFLIGVILTD